MKRSPTGRPAPRVLFLAPDRRLEVYFYTSSTEKFLQARFVFERFGLTLKYFRGRSEPYSEDYVSGKDALLSRAIEQVTSSVGRGTFLFVEDTSLRIETLSSTTDDWPGLAVKEWFASTSFAELDSKLRDVGNGRAAIIKSDIALHVPGLDRPVMFHGEVRGVVADSAPDFEESSQYPWLTPSTFNGWFIPDGATKRLGEMSFDESWHYDFRVKALVALVERLEEYAGVLNAPPQSYTRKSREVQPEQPSFLPHDRPTLVVVGRTCAGKTTFGDIALQDYGRRHIEASSIVRMFREEDAGADAFSFAKQLLTEKGPAVVARRILQLYADDIANGPIITGFRTIEEVEIIRKEVPGAKIVFIDSSERTRFHRHLKRGRTDEAVSLAEFRRLDQQQEVFGLLPVAQDFADIRIVNEGSLRDYRKQVGAVVSGQVSQDVQGVSSDVRPRFDPEESQLVRVLSALDDAGVDVDCNEIETRTVAKGIRVRANNANQLLKKVPALAARRELRGNPIRYQITDAGRTYLRLVRMRSRPTPTPQRAISPIGELF